VNQNEQYNAGNRQQADYYNGNWDTQTQGLNYALGLDSLNFGNTLNQNAYGIGNDLINRNISEWQYGQGDQQNNISNLLGLVNTGLGAQQFASSGGQANTQQSANQIFTGGANTASNQLNAGMYGSQALASGVTGAFGTMGNTISNIPMQSAVMDYMNRQNSGGYTPTPTTSFQPTSSFSLMKPQTSVFAGPVQPTGY
jgi:hypothetical protein